MLFRSAPPIPDWALPDDCFIHNTKSLGSVKAEYERRCFDTSVILQSHTHEEPTCAKAIGFPFNFPRRESLSRWGGYVVLRLHIGLYRDASGYIVSIPHLEPDPAYCPLEHLDMFTKEDAIEGVEAVSFLKAFLGYRKEWNLIHQ